MAIDLILFGSMGSGKTTVGRVLQEEAGRTVVAAHQLIRANYEAAGPEVRKLREQGYLLPDELVARWVFDALEPALDGGRPVVLDGFPRTAPQAERLLARFRRRDLGRVAYLRFDPRTLLRRVEARLLCARCEMPTSRRFADFHGACTYCGGRKLSPRPTDRPDYFKVKTAQFRSESMPVLPLLVRAGLQSVGLASHRRFATLRAEILALAGAG